MARKRKFVYDKALGKTVEITPEGDRKFLDEVSESVKPFWEPVETSVKASKRRNVNGGWPFASMAAAIDPEDIPVEQALLRQHGVLTEYTRTGEPIFRDRAHRKAHLRAVGMYDRDAGYGDPEPIYYTGGNRRS